MCVQTVPYNTICRVRASVPLHISCRNHVIAVFGRVDRTEVSTYVMRGRQLCTCQVWSGTGNV